CAVGKILFNERPEDCTDAPEWIEANTAFLAPSRSYAASQLRRASRCRSIAAKIGSGSPVARRAVGPQFGMLLMDAVCRLGDCSMASTINNERQPVDPALCRALPFGSAP